VKDVDSAWKMADANFNVCIEADQSVAAVISAVLEDANRAVGHDRARKHFYATLRRADGSVEGGITAQSFWEWLYIADLAIKPECRGMGFGRKLLAAAEAWGSEQGCRNAWLMTMSFQAKEFYERAGYRSFAELTDYPPGESRLFLAKSLTGGMQPDGPALTAAFSIVPR
jgi:ribosomal protein S18 acetylase RimI-like enzyme